MENETKIHQKNIGEIIFPDVHSITNMKNTKTVFFH